MKPFQRSESDPKALPVGQEGSGDPSGGLAGFGRPARWAWRDREATPEGWDGLGVSPRWLGGVGRPSRPGGV